MPGANSKFYMHVFKRLYKKIRVTVEKLHDMAQTGPDELIVSLRRVHGPPVTSQTREIFYLFIRSKCTPLELMKFTPQTSNVGAI